MLASLRRPPQKSLFHQSVILSRARQRVLLLPSGWSRAQSKDLGARTGDDRNGFELLQAKPVRRSFAVSTLRYEARPRSGNLGPSTAARRHPSAKHISRSPSLRMMEFFCEAALSQSSSAGWRKRADQIPFRPTEEASSRRAWTWPEPLFWRTWGPLRAGPARPRPSPPGAW
jgi:hypothetical protein